MLAWQVIAAAGYSNIDPSHPHGGPTRELTGYVRRTAELGARRLLCRGEKTYTTIKNKLVKDMKGAKPACSGHCVRNNQELRLSEREKLEQLDPGLKVGRVPPAARHRIP